MNGFVYSGIKLEQINSSDSSLSFDCGDTDLNAYFHTDSANYRKELLTASYKVIREETDFKYPIAFVDLCNDAVRKEELGGAKRKIHHLKRGFKTFPAVKITRLGVKKSLQGQGLGSLVLDMLKHFCIEERQFGCRFLTLDAYPERVDFYKKNHFRELLLKDESIDKETVPMFFDLKELIQVSQ